MVRTLAWPASPNSRIMLDVRVKAVSVSEWATDIYVTGAYDGPNDIAANEDYRIEWQADGGRLLEKGSVTLVRSSGETIDGRPSSHRRADRTAWRRCCRCASNRVDRAVTAQAERHELQLGWRRDACRRGEAE